MMHIWVSKLAIIGWDNGLSPGRRQAIIWINAGILLIGPLGTNFIEILIEILTFSLKKIRLEISSAKWQPSCLGLNVLKSRSHDTCNTYVAYMTYLVLTHWGRDKMSVIFADILICIFLNENFWISNKISLKYVP